jgi:hypothetical protein
VPELELAAGAVAAGVVVAVVAAVAGWIRVMAAPPPIRAEPPRAAARSKDLVRFMRGLLSGGCSHSNDSSSRTIGRRRKTGVGPE